MLNNWLNKKYLNKSTISNIKENFRSAKPYPNFCLCEFFNNEKINTLKQEILKQNFKRHDKDLFSLSNTNELKFSNSKVIEGFYSFLSSHEFLDFMMQLTGSRNLTHIDMHAHKMVNGDYLLFHDDVVGGRKIAYILYLCDFTKEDGGRLQLFDVKNPRKPIVQVIPKFNSFACFEVSSKSLHVVEEVMGKKDRITVGGWFYG